MGCRVVGLFFIKINVHFSGKKIFWVTFIKIKSTGTDNQKCDSVLFLQSTATELLLKASTEYQYRITLEVPVPTLDYCYNTLLPKTQEAVHTMSCESFTYWDLNSCSTEHNLIYLVNITEKKLLSKKNFTITKVHKKKTYN